MTAWLLLLAAGGLVAANGLFVAAEFSLVAADRAAVERAAEDGDRRAGRVLAALRSLSTQLSAAQLGITITSLLVGFIAEPSLARLLSGPLESAGLASGPGSAVSVGLALFIATVVQMVFAELVPKNLAIARPLPVARAVAAPHRAFTAATRPLTQFLNGTANRIVRAVGVEPQEELSSARSPREIASLVARSGQEGTLPEDTATLVTRSLAFGDRTAHDVMTPRVRVRFLPGDASAETLLDVAEESGFSRFPVHAGSADEVVGIVHLKHALAVPPDERTTRRVRDLAEPPLEVPGSIELDPLLLLLRDRGLQMAVVVDEYGGTDGIVTLEDLVEELVGEIADEQDPSGARALQRDDGSWSLSGLLRPDEVAEFTGVELPEGEEYDTVAGLVLDRLGRLPDVGEQVMIASGGLGDDEGSADAEPARDAEQAADDLSTRGVVLTVERLDGRRIDRVRLAPQPGHDPLEAHDDGSDEPSVQAPPDAETAP